MMGGAGLTSALVIEREDDADTVHTVFWANLAMAAIMSLVLYLAAGPLAALMGAAEAAGLLRVMAFLIPIQLSGDVVYALLARRMNFSADAVWSTISETLAALIAVAMALRSEEHTSALQSLMRISYAVFCLKTKTTPLLKL